MLLSRLTAPPELVDEPILDSLCDADSPRGILAVAKLPRRGPEALPPTAAGTILFLDGIQEPGNLGAIARVGEAFGVRALALGAGCAHPNHPRALRASAGSLLRLPVAVGVEVQALERRLGDPRAGWIGLVARGGGPPTPAPAGARRVLVLGSEGGGISATVDARLDERWTLPIQRPVESLNVAVAAGIALFASRSNAPASM